VKKDVITPGGPESDGAGLHSPTGTSFERVLGIGAQTAVFVVRRGEEHLVCKRLVQRALAESSARESVRREGGILDALKGRGAPRLIAHGDGNEAEGPYLLLELVAAPELSAGLQGLPLVDVARVCFAALADVHDAADEHGALGIVHRDVTPGNVLLARHAARAVLVDFGLAYGRDWPASDTGTFRGTLRFAAPESARGEPQDARSDLFSMGASLLSVATGSEARDSAHPAALLAEAGSVPLDGLLTRARGSLAPKVVEVLAGCVAFEREARPASARAVHAALGLC